MSYVDGSKVDPIVRKRERELLISGLSYTEVAERTRGRVKSISERNRLVYHINIWEAFQRRIKRDGIPNRLSVSDNFGYWLSGFFDGEGTLTIFTRLCTANPKYREYRLNIRLMIRDDDAHVIRSIQDNLQVGRISLHKRNRRTNPAIA